MVSNIKTQIRHKTNANTNKRKTFLKDEIKLAKRNSKNKKMYYSKIEQW